MGLLVLHGSSIWDSEPLIDEQIYEAAISRAAEGASPYEQGGFFYPPTFARAGVGLRAALGPDGARTVMRTANVFGLLYLLWFTVVLGVTGGPSDRRNDSGPKPRGTAVGAAPASSNPRVLLLCLLLPLGLILLPGVRLGLSTGNFSFLVGAAAVFALWIADRRPLIAGLLLGSTLLIKPLVAGALPLLLVPSRPGRRWMERLSPSRIVTAAVATGSASLFLWFDRAELGTMFATELGGVPKGRSLSIYRFARELGLGEMRIVLFVVVVLILCLALWGRLRDRRDLLVASTLAVPMTTLVVWSHTLIMCLPLASLAAHRLLERRRDDDVVGFGGEPRHRIEAVLVCGATALLVFAHPGGFGDQPGLVQALLLAPFLAAPIVLAGFWFRTSSTTPSVH